MQELKGELSISDMIKKELSNISHKIKLGFRADNVKKAFLAFIIDVKEGRKSI